jgi:anti-sigma B factor antagonist
VLTSGVTSVQALDGAMVIHVRGELDVANSVQLRGVLMEAIRRRPVRVAVDLMNVTFIDSTAIGALVAAADAARLVGVEFGLRNPTPWIIRQLRLAGVYRHLNGADA